jgi:hypothetical protein
MPQAIFLNLAVGRVLSIATDSAIQPTKAKQAVSALDGMPADEEGDV